MRGVASMFSKVNAALLEIGPKDLYAEHLS